MNNNTLRTNFENMIDSILNCDSNVKQKEIDEDLDAFVYHLFALINTDLNHTTFTLKNLYMGKIKSYLEDAYESSHFKIEYCMVGIEEKETYSLIFSNRVSSHDNDGAKVKNLILKLIGSINIEKINNGIEERVYNSDCGLSSLKIEIEDGETFQVLYKACIEVDKETYEKVKKFCEENNLN